jgi:hypothetical protein
VDPDVEKNVLKSPTCDILRFNLIYEGENLVGLKVSYSDIRYLFTSVLIVQEYMHNVHLAADNRHVFFVYTYDNNSIINK